MEIISKIVDAGSLDTILRDYNKDLIIAAFNTAVQSHRDEDKLLLFKYLSYLSQSIIMWFENNYPEIFEKGPRVWGPVISSLILESLPSDAQSDALNNMIQFLSIRLYPPDIHERPIEIAREALSTDLLARSFNTAPIPVNITTIITTASNIKNNNHQHMTNIHKMSAVTGDLLQDDNVTRFLPVSAEGGGGGGGGGGSVRGFVSPSKDPPPLENLVNTQIRYVDERDNSVKSGILTDMLDGNRVFVVTKDGVAGGAGRWVDRERLVLNRGGGSRRRKTRKKKKRKKQKTRRRRKKHKRKTRRKR